MTRVVKRDGRVVKFDRNKIINAVLATFESVDHEIDDYAEQKANNIATHIEEYCAEQKISKIQVDQIHTLVENGLMATKRKDVARAYVSYRDDRTRLRGNSTDKAIKEIVEGANEYWNTENSNKNAKIASTQRDYLAGQTSEDLSRRELLPTDVVKAHDEGLIHFHDIDYFLQHIHNCALMNLGDMLQNGTVVNGTLIEKPHSIGVAATVATQLMADFASGQYGGQSINLADLAPFVDVSRQKIRNRLKAKFTNTEIEYNSDQLEKLVEMFLREEISDAMQTMQYQINTLNTSNGQTPFVTVFMYLNQVPEGPLRDDLALLIEEMINQRIKGVKNPAGQVIAPTFPKLIYVTQDDNIDPKGKYYYLTQLAAKCIPQRMVPDIISEKIMKQLKGGDCYSVMGCRSALTPDRFSDKIGNVANALDYVKGQHKYSGRFNQGVVTINLPDVALTANKEERDFWEVLDERLIICHKALRCRHERLLGTRSDISPIHWQYGGLARLQPGETIDKLLYNGYSTISLGYCGLWECVYAYTGHKLIDEEGKAFGLEVMQKLNDYCAKWKKEENIDYSLYGTPLESTTYKFAKSLKKRFGVIEGVTDKNYVTNSYHIHVTEPIDAFSKLAFEAQFQALSPGGAISYIEAPDLKGNEDAVMEVIKFIHENIMYAEINTKLDHCQVCGYDGECSIVEDAAGKLEWECPCCGNRDFTKMNITRRTCGYLGSQGWNQGRTAEIKDRVIHLDN